MKLLGIGVKRRQKNTSSEGPTLLEGKYLFKVNSQVGRRCSKVSVGDFEQILAHCVNGKLYPVDKTCSKIAMEIPRQ